MASDILAFPHLPAVPMAMMLARLEGLQTMDSVCRKAGIADRSYREWREGSRATIEFRTADRILTRLGLLWWEVWDEETTRLYGLIVVSYAQRLNRGKDRATRYRRERVRTRRYWDLGPDYEGLARVEYAFTGERPDLGEQLELAA